MQTTLIAAIFVVVWSARCLAEPPATRPALVLAEDTTVVMGPVEADGTINYVAALNDMLGKDITPENNAAILLLQASGSPEMRTRYAGCMEELKVPPLTDGPPLVPFTAFARERANRVINDAELDAMEAAARDRPWKKEEFPEIAAYLDEHRAALELVGEASRRPRFFTPFVSKRTPPSTADAMPPLTPAMWSYKALQLRAMRRAGEGDLRGALGDLDQIRLLGRLSAQGELDIYYLLGLAADSIAIRSYQTLLANGHYTAKQRQEIVAAMRARPLLPPAGARTYRAERLFACDMVMQMIRGEGQRVWAGILSPINPPANLNLGDLPNADWNALLRGLGEAQGRLFDKNALPYMEQLKALEISAEEAKADGAPQSEFFGEDLDLQGRRVAEAYFNMRNGETREAFSRRMGRALLSVGGGWEAGFLKIRMNYELQASLVDVAAALEDFREAHGDYPERLEELKIALPRDLLGEGPPHYRRKDGGYTVWIVGANKVDENGEGDDMPMGTRK